MRILVLNAGSSSLKFDLFESEGEVRLFRGAVERVSDMTAALDAAFVQIEAALGGEPVAAVGHRFVTGGPLFSDPVELTPDIALRLESVQGMAPLHMPPNLAGYRAVAARLPQARQVAVFDTAFHSRMPPQAYRYAIPESVSKDHSIRRYGFHGLSHRYVSGRYAELNGPGARLITCHLGNGCSIAAVERGVSIDTSMGFTPLEGLVMGSRCGDIDAGAVLHLILRCGYDPVQLERLLNSQSGLFGLSGLSNDMRDLHRASAEGHRGAALAIDTFCYRARKYVGAYFAAMDGAEGLIFTGGIGENDALVRAQICAGLSSFGIVLDGDLNFSSSREARCISKGPLAVWVIPTNEELLIARDTLSLLSAQ